MSLSIVSWNIFANFDNLEKRTIAIGEKLASLDADVILLQEVVPFTANVILDKLGDGYYSLYRNVYENNNPSRCFGEMIIVKKNITVLEKRVVYFPTYDGRCATVAKLHDGKQTYVVGTVHLDGKPLKYPTARFWRIRDSQLETINSVLDSYGDFPIVFCGDFNFTENETLSDGYIDAWKHLGSPEEHRYTWSDSERYDRAYCKNIYPKIFKKGTRSDKSDHDYIWVVV